jgi:hypothetical protein
VLTTEVNYRTVQIKKKCMCISVSTDSCNWDPCKSGTYCNYFQNSLQCTVLSFRVHVPINSKCSVIVGYSRNRVLSLSYSSGVSKHERAWRKALHTYTQCIKNIANSILRVAFRFQATSGSFSQQFQMQGILRCWVQMYGLHSTLLGADVRTAFYAAGCRCTNCILRCWVQMYGLYSTLLGADVRTVFYAAGCTCTDCILRCWVQMYELYSTLLGANVRTVFYAAGCRCTDCHLNATISRILAERGKTISSGNNILLSHHSIFSMWYNDRVHSLPRERICWGVA